MKVEISDQFSRFEEKAHKGAFAEARKTERVAANGIPLKTGTTGTAVVSGINATMTRPNQKGDSFPRISIALTVEAPEDARGTILTNCNKLNHVIKDPDKKGSTWTKEKAWGALWGALEDCGLPEEHSLGEGTLAEACKWFQEKPRVVEFEVFDDGYVKDGKRVENKNVYIRPASLLGDTPESQQGSENPLPSSTETSSNQDADQEDGKDYCMYRGQKHEVISADETHYVIVGLNTGVERRVRKDDEKVEIL